VRDLVADAGVVAGGLHQIGQMRPVDVAHLVEALDAVVVRVTAGEHHIARGHAVADLHVGVIEAQAADGEPVHLRRGVGQLAAVDADGVATHVIGGDDEDVEARGGGGEGGQGEGEEEDGEAEQGRHGGRSASHRIDARRRAEATQDLAEFAVRA
jgi:hypothetical protein